MPRCFNCNKKTGIMGIICNYCNENFCYKCRVLEDHNCPCLKDKIHKETQELKVRLELGRERSKSEQFGI